MYLLRINVKRFLRSPLKLGIFLILSLWISYYFKTTTIFWNAVNKPIDLMITVLPYLFLGCLLLSYEMFYDQKRYRVDEILDMDRRCVFRERMATWWLLVVLDLIISVGMFGFQIYCYRQAGVVCGALIKYTLRVIVIYVFLMSLVAIQFGWIAASARNNLIGLTILVVTFYLFDRRFVSLILGMDENSRFLWRLGTLFSFFFQSKRATVRDADYLLSAENVHVYRALFFLFLTTAVLMWSELQKRWAAAFSAIMGVVCLVLFFQPTGAVYNMMEIWNYQDSVFYLERYSQEDEAQRNTRMCRENRDDFYVCRYDMDIRVTDQLKASVTIVPSDTGLEQYQFTLHYLFAVSKVTDGQGHPLTYRQDGDYLLVESPGDLQQIHIEYEGETSYFYATTQGMILPANYEYFPVPGWHKVFINNNDEEEQKILDATFTREVLSHDAQFKVHLSVKSDYPVYSNLPCQKQKSEHGFTEWILSGQSNGLTLIGNPYLIDREIDGVKVVCSRLDLENVPLGENVSRYREYFRSLRKECGIKWNGTTFIVSPDCNYINYCYGDDHTVDTLLGLDTEVRYRKDGILYSYSDLDQ